MSDSWFTRPIFFVADVERATAFYVGALSFVEEWRHADQGQVLVAQVTRGDCHLLLDSQQPDRTGRGRLFI